MLNISWVLIAAIFSLATLHAGIEKHFKPAPNKTAIHRMDHIDYVYMINLDKRPEKYARTMKALEPYGITPYRFSAVNGWELSFEAIDELGIVYEEGMPYGPIATVYRHVNGKEYSSFEIMKEPGVTYYCHCLSRGAIGCLLSHVSILQDAYDSDYQTIWIMEDDIKVVSNPNELSGIVTDLNHLAPNWDVLFTDNEIKGGNCEPVPCLMIRPRPLVHLQPLSYYLQRTPLNHELTKIGMRFGSASMIISRSGIEKLLNYFKTYKVYFPYDIDYFFVPGINLYACNRDIVTNTSGGESDNGSPTYLDKE